LENSRRQTSVAQVECLVRERVTSRTRHRCRNDARLAGSDHRVIAGPWRQWVRGGPWGQQDAADLLVAAGALRRSPNWHARSGEGSATRAAGWRVGCGPSERRAACDGPRLLESSWRPRNSSPGSRRKTLVGSSFRPSVAD